MSGLQNLLVATDLSPGAELALAWLRPFSISAEFRLTVVSVLPPSPGIGLLSPPTRKGISLHRGGEAHEREAEIRRRMAALGLPGSRLAVRVLEGSPVREILGIAEQIGPDLILMGSRSKGPSKRAFVGSTAAGVIRAARCPVFAAREAPPAGGGGGVVMTTDLSTASWRALPTAVELARNLGAPLHIVHVVEPLALLAEPQRGRELALEIESSIRRRAKDPQIRIEVLFNGVPLKAVSQYVNQVDANVIVMATHGWGATVRLLVGSTCERFIRGSPVSVLVVPKPRRA